MLNEQRSAPERVANGEISIREVELCFGFVGPRSNRFHPSTPDFRFHAKRCHARASLCRVRLDEWEIVGREWRRVVVGMFRARAVP